MNFRPNELEVSYREIIKTKSYNYPLHTATRSQGEVGSGLELQEDMSGGAERGSPGSSHRSPGSLSSSSPLSSRGSRCDRSSDCDFWRPPSPSSSPGGHKGPDKNSGEFEYIIFILSLKTKS